MDDSTRADAPVRDDQQPRRDDAAWTAAPAAAPHGEQDPHGQYDQYDQQDQYGHGRHGQQPQYGHGQQTQQSPYGQYGQPGTSNPVGPTPWYGAAAGTRATAKPKPPWFWPVVAVVVGLAALLAGGGAGFAIGHAIASHQSQSGTQFPGRGTNQLPGQGGGTGQFPGQSGGTGTSSGTGTGTGTGTGGTNGSAANS